MQTSEISAQVVIVGAGPVGLCIANILGASGIDTLLLERTASSHPLPRAQTLDDEGLRTLQAIDLADAFLPTTLRAEGARYFDATGACFARVGPGDEPYGFARRNYIRQERLDRLLLEGLNRYRSVRTRFNTEVTGLNKTGETVTLQARDDKAALQIRARYVLACDGGRSRCREALGIQMQGWTYVQDWIVLDAIDDPDRSRVSKFFCDPAGPSVSIASPDGGRRYEFMLLEDECAETALAPSSLARRLAPFRPYDPKSILRATVYTFHARIAERLSQGNVFLLGDAAHLTPPFAGQGMNAGLRDAHNLGWKLALVCHEQADAGILASYEQERREPIWAMIQLAVAMGEFVMPTTAVQRALKESLMTALERFPKARDYLFQMRFKPRPRYDRGMFIDLNHQSFEGSLVGQMLPQPWIIDQNGARKRLDTQLGPGFALLCQDRNGADRLAACTHPLLKTLSISRTCLALHDGVDTCSPVRRATALDTTYLRAIRAHRDQLILIRPDRYVLGACWPCELDGFLDRVQTLLQNPCLAQNRPATAVQDGAPFGADGEKDA